tara:strand:- start:56 stop:556 length:501 start_codon:yes stop_codon:yes gene_type:complete
VYTEEQWDALTKSAERTDGQAVKYVAGKKQLTALRTAGTGNIGGAEWVTRGSKGNAYGKAFTSIIGQMANTYGHMGEKKQSAKSIVLASGSALDIFRAIVDKDNGLVVTEGTPAHWTTTQAGLDIGHTVQTLVANAGWVKRAPKQTKNQKAPVDAATQATLDTLNL